MSFNYMMKMKMKMEKKSKRMKMEITSSPELAYGFLLLFSLFIFSFPNLSSSQYHSPPRNIETFYPYWPPVAPQQSPPSPSPYIYSPPPPSLGPHPPPPQPPQAPSSSPSKAIITAVGVTAASALVAAALLFLLLSRRRKSTSKGDGGSDGRSPLPAATISRSEVTRVGGNVIVDEDGLDHLYWKELKKSQNGPSEVPSSNRSRIHPDPGAGHRSTSVALQAVANSGGEGSQRQPMEQVVADPSRGDIMEAIFGTVAINRRSPREENISRSVASESSDPGSKIFILDPQKSDNIMTVLRSLGMPRVKLISALLEGKGMSEEALVQLTSIAPTSDQVSEILAYNGDPVRLADAEAFLYAVLKAVPSAFVRADQMLFWCHYDFEVLNLKESLQTLELACDELRTRGIILKLLQAIHSTGTRLCVGSLSEEAKAFKLSTLRKLSEYKSTDGKTTLLHFVVHQVVRNEGKRCVMARNNSMSRQNTNPAPLVDTEDLAAAKLEKEKEFLMLGLPIVGGLSYEFSNVKKAANMDYDGLKETLASLVSRVREARRLITNDKSTDGGGGFQMEMRYLLESAEVETKAGQVEHTRVMSLVEKTAQYYQPEGASNDNNPLQLFVILKDFLSMIDQTCVEIARNLQQNQAAAGVSSDLGSDSSQPDVLRSRVNFPRIPQHFFSDTPTGNVGDDS